MRFLIDANLSPRLATLLASEGHDAVAIRQVGLSEASDNEIVDYAANDDRIVVSYDTDFGALLAFRELTRPSFILFRSSDPITPEEQASLSSSPISTPLLMSSRGAQSWSSLAAASEFVVCPFVDRPTLSQIDTSAISSKHRREFGVQPPRFMTPYCLDCHRVWLDK